MILWDTIHRALFAKPMPEAERAELRANMLAAELKGTFAFTRREIMENPMIVAAWQTPLEIDYYIGRNEYGEAFAIPHVAGNWTAIRRMPGYDGAGELPGTPVPHNLIAWCADPIAQAMDPKRIGIISRSDSERLFAGSAQPDLIRELNQRI